MVVEILVDDDVEHRHEQSRVGAGAQAQVVLCAGGDPVGTRVDGDELRAALHEVDDRVAEEAVGVRRQRVLADEHDDLGNLELGVVVGALEAACEVDFGIHGTQNVGGSRHAGQVARVAGLGVAVVRGCEHGCRIGHERAALTAGAGPNSHGGRAVLAGDALPLGLDEVERLVPGDALPLVGLAAELRIALHRILDAVLVVDVVLQGQAANAQTALGDRLVLVAFNLDELAFFVGVELNAAAYRMASRRRPHAGAGDSQSLFLESPRLADVVFKLHFSSSELLLRNGPLLSHPVHPSSIYLRLTGM